MVDSIINSLTFASVNFAANVVLQMVYEQKTAKATKNRHKKPLKYINSCQIIVLDSVISSQILLASGQRGEARARAGRLKYIFKNTHLLCDKRN